MVNKSIINTAKKYLETIPKELNVKKAYLFGSFAKGKEKENSDIDIALIIGNMTDFYSTQKQLMQLRRSIDLRIEPHPIGEIDFNEVNPFAQEIQNSGIEITLN